MSYVCVMCKFYYNTKIQYVMALFGPLCDVWKRFPWEFLYIQLYSPYICHRKQKKKQ